MHKKFSIRRLIGMLSAALMISGAGFIAISAPAVAGTDLGYNSTVDYAGTLSSGAFLATSVSTDAANSALDLSATFAIEAWAKPNSTQVTNCIASPTPSGLCVLLYRRNSYGLGIFNGTWQFALKTATLTWTWQDTGQKAYPSRWQHLALVGTGTALKFFFDGRQVYSLAGVQDPDNQTEPLEVGTTYAWSPANAGDYPFRGEIDEIKIWDGSDRSGQIENDMHQYGSGNGSTFDNALKHYYDFNEGYATGSSTQKVFDRVGTSHLVSRALSTTYPVCTDVKSTTQSGKKTVVSFPRTYLTPVGGWTVPANMTKVQALVVAGGGAGGGGGDSTGAGGGGAGGFVETVLSTTASSAVQVKVGQGGVPNKTSHWLDGLSGQDSIFGSASATGGGGGGGRQSTSGLAGGSGGGVSGRPNSPRPAGGSGVAGQGFSGGTGRLSGEGTGGASGGGGASAAGATASGLTGGAGGAGKASQIDGQTYSVGGTGGTSNITGYGANGSANTGNGGNGSNGSYVYSQGTWGFGGYGGSGIVLISYAPAEDRSLNITSKTAYAKTTSQFFPTSTAQNFTFEAWIKPRTLTSATWQPILATPGDQIFSNRFWIGFNGSKLVLADGAAQDRYSVNAIRTNEWTHIGLTFSGSTVSLYLNGNLDTTWTITRVSHDAGLNVGYSDNTGTTQFFDGNIDQIKLWNAALSQDQLARSMHMYADSDGSGTVSGLTNHYDFNEESGAVQDQKGSLQLTLVGSPTRSDVVSSAVGSTNTVYKFTRTILNAWGGWVPGSSMTANLLAVAGGGGGGSPHGGGGGAGGLASATDISLSGVVPVKVGQGGLGQSQTGVGTCATTKTTYQGQSSIIGSITVPGGGAGAMGCNGATSQASNTQGGSGGGAAYRSSDTANYRGATNIPSNSGTITYYGNIGSYGSYNATGDDQFLGGGGGGAGSAATDGTSASAGIGGSGFKSNISGSEVCYAAGGGGGAGSAQSGTAGAGGTCSGMSTTAGAGSRGQIRASDAAANTGSGGGGGGYEDIAGNDKLGAAGNGGSGVVIVSVKTANAITFDANTGTGTLATQYINVGSSANLTSIGSSINKSNNSFAGWATSSGGAVVYADGASITPSGDMTLYAKWTASSVNVTFVTNSGTSLTATTAVIGGTLAQPGTTTRNGYAFAGWYAASDLSGSAISSWPYTHGQTSDFSLYAKWTANTYTITYKAGTNGSGADLTQTFTFSNTATLKDATAALTRTGYAISGWSTTNGGSQNYALSGSYADAANLTLYPVWTANTYTITYRAGTGGTGSNLTQTFVYGNTATLKDATAALTREGYAISGWSTTDGGSQVHALSGSYSSASDLTLYPVWSANTYTITYKAGTGGTGSDIVQSFVYGNTATLRDATAPITRDGYSISGWSTTNGGSQTNALSGSYSSASNLILYPVWSANTYDVTYDEQGGSSVTDATYQTAGSLALPGTPTRNGYTFRGWYNASTGGTKLGNASATINPTTTADITIYAQWMAIDYSVTYNNNSATGGSVPSDVTVYHYGDNVAVRGNTGNLSLEGYSFGGWTTTQNSGTAYNSGEVLVISGNLTFYVKWTANTYTVSYDTNGASGSPSVSTKSYTTGGTAITHPTVGSMARTGYTFGGWSETANGAALTGTYTTAADKTLYAVWTIKAVSITYDKGAASASTFSSFPTTLSSTYGARATLSSNIDSLVDISGVTYEFLGWSDGTDKFAAGASYLLGDTNVTMTAQWARVFQVQYVLNGGSGITTSDTECATNAGGGVLLCSNNQVITASASPNRTGYSFTGWKNQSALSIAAGAQFTVNSGSYLLYAQWTPTDYGVTYYTAGGSTPPTALIKNYGDIFTVGSAVTRTGYTFAGWSDGTTTYGVGASYQMPANNVSLTAQWTPNVYTVTYDWNGGTGSATANASYTVGTSGLTLPTVGNHVKDGYSFGGWSETRGGTALSGPYSPTASLALYAVWTLGNYTVTYDANGGTVGTSSAQVTNGGSVTLPTPTRTSYVFDGWYTAASGGTKHGNAGATFTPSASSTVYAHWIQESLYGINPAHLTRLASVNASSTVQTNITGSNAGSSVQVVVPAGAFAQNGTTVNIDLVGDFSRADSLLSDPNAYIVSMVVSWVAPDGTVPNTAAGKPIAVTIQNSTIKAGSKIYSILGTNVTVLGTATQDGTVTVSLTHDPEIVVAATVPDAPTTVTATAGSTGTAVVNWNAPTSNGGATITGYTVTASTGQSCTSATTSCIVSGLTSGASYTFTVVATNSVGNSTASSASSSLAMGAAPLSSSPNVGGGTPVKAPLAVGDKNMQIIAVDKKKVATTGGSVVKLDTRNISKITEVTVDGKKAKIISTVDGQIKVEMPKNTSGEAKVVLSGPDGQVTLEQVISYAAPKPVATVKSIAIPQGIWTIATPEMQKLKTTLAKNADAVVITCEGYQSYSYNTAFDALVAKQRAKTACAYLAGGNSSITVVTKVVRTKLTGPASRKLKVTFSAVR